MEYLLIVYGIVVVPLVVCGLFVVYKIRQSERAEQTH